MPKLTGLDWDDWTAFDVQNKGWYEQAQLQLDDGTRVPLSFWDPVRLDQELQDHFASGKIFFAVRNLIVVPLVTEDAIRDAVRELLTKGFFSSPS
jgi:hypothetical protein